LHTYQRDLINIPSEIDIKSAREHQFAIYSLQLARMVGREEGTQIKQARYQVIVPIYCFFKRSIAWLSIAQIKAISMEIATLR